MFSQNLTNRFSIAFLAVSLVVGVATGPTWADDGPHHGHDEGYNQQHSAPAVGHHGGQVTKTKDFCIEVVYQPRETQIYLSDHNHQPRSLRGVRGEVSMQLRSSGKSYRFPAKYVAGKKRTDQDYLAVFADVSGIRDGDMQVAIHLNNLPGAHERTADFRQNFALAKFNVAFARLTSADQAAIAHQDVCPVTGVKLGSHGSPIKALIGDQPVYLCCKGCIRKLQAEPQAYLAKIASPRGN